MYLMPSSLCVPLFGVEESPALFSNSSNISLVNIPRMFPFQASEAESGFSALIYAGFCCVGDSQAKVQGKHRKSSSQPSSCSQNTESSSTTPEPTHESSDNEGEWGLGSKVKG